MSDLTRYRPMQEGETAATAYTLRRAGFPDGEFTIVVPDDTLQQIADAWAKYNVPGTPEMLRSQGRDLQSLFDLLDGLVRVSVTGREPTSWEEATARERIPDDVLDVLGEPT